MQTSALRYFLEVAAQGSIRKAAERLHVAASAISRQIAILERQFGGSLLTRHPLGVRLTPAGEMFARQARATLKDLEQVKSDIDNLQEQHRGAIRIACSEGAVADLLFATLADLAQRPPAVAYDVMVMGSRKALEAVAREHCDIAVAFSPRPHPDVEVIRSAPHPTCVVLHPGHLLAKQAHIELGQLVGSPVGMLDETFAVRDLVDRAVASEGLRLQTAVTINTIEAAKAYARNGLGVTFMPLYAVRRELAAGTLKAALVSNPFLSASTVGLCVHRARSVPQAAQDLVGALSTRFDAYAQPTAQIGRS